MIWIIGWALMGLVSFLFGSWYEGEDVTVYDLFKYGFVAMLFGVPTLVVFVCEHLQNNDRIILKGREKS